MTAAIVTVAEAIKDELSNVTLSETFQAVRSYADWDDLLSDMDAIRVDVVPSACPSTLLSRSKLSYTCTTNILIRKRFAATDRQPTGRFDNASIDTLVNDLQTINEHFAPSQTSQTGTLAGVSNAQWVEESGIKAPYSRMMLREHNQFSGWVSLVYRVARSPA